MRFEPCISPGSAGRPIRRAGTTPRSCPGAGVAARPLCSNPAFRITTSLLFLLSLLPHALHGQTWGTPTESRRGFWLGAGLGQGYTDLRCGICGGDREAGGVSGYVRAGGTVTPRFLLGGELSVWRRGGEITEHLGALAGTALLYPNARHGWFLKLGLGYSRYRASQDDDALVSHVWSAQTGLGYEMRVNPGVSLVPYVTALITPQGNLNREDTRNGGYRAERVATDLNLLSIQFGVGITRH